MNHQHSHKMIEEDAAIIGDRIFPVEELVKGTLKNRKGIQGEEVQTIFIDEVDSLTEEEVVIFEPKGNDSNDHVDVTPWNVRHHLPLTNNGMSVKKMKRMQRSYKNGGM